MAIFVETDKQLVSFRFKIVQSRLKHKERATDIASAFRTSKKTVYKWIKRFLLFGAEGLKNMSKAPKQIPHKIKQGLEQKIKSIRKKKNHLGARRLARELKSAKFGKGAIHNALKRLGLVGKYKRKKRKYRRFERKHPNSLFQCDLAEEKIQGKTRHIITVLDDHSRYVLACKVCKTKSAKSALTALSTAFETATPKQLLTDNGKCFYAKKTQRFLEKAKQKQPEFKHIHSTPQHPQTLGKLERFNRTLRDECLQYHKPTNIEQLQATIDKFIQFYNNKRVHSGIGNIPPVKRYHPE